MKLSAELLDGLTDFLITNIESKALYGITYVMALQSDTELISSCQRIKENALKSGFGPEEVFRVYQVVNGYIFDMDLSVAKYLTGKLAIAVAKTNKDVNLNYVPNGDLIGNGPEKRRREDMQNLAKYCKSQYEKGIMVFEVALFSRNSVPRIVINGSDSSKGNAGKPVIVTYNAYAIRHWDIEEVNRNLLVPAGIHITKIKPCEILPSKTGVRFELTLARAY